MSSTDQIQILFEKPYQEVRMPEIGTDAFERTRVANPQSMLDADFEYGLQPTKWLTYDLMRGYPSIYEIPGTDQSISTVTTDASTGTGGLGESLITITASSAFPSSWAVGSPITVKGYLNTVTGFARAEGSFIINSISGNVLTYYAKAKVGVNNGDLLSTVYTQLRQGSFYTGSSVGSPTYSYANPTALAGGSSSSIATATVSVTGSISGTTLTTSGGSPAIGQVLSGGGVVAGTYIVSGSASTWTVSTSQSVGSNTFTATTNTLTVGGTASGTWAVGQAVSGTGVANSTTIIALGSGSGGLGTYFVNVAQTTGPTAMSGTTASAVITVTFATNHGFVPSNTIISQVLSDTGINNNALAQGPFFIETVPSPTTLTFTARASGILSGTLSGVIFSRPDAFYSHRPFDGGVILGTGGPAYGSMAVRMSKKYIRYQSGKAINYNTGALFAPNYDIRSISASGTIVGSTITVVTDDVDHGCQIGAQVTVSGVTTTGYNGTYTVNNVVDERTITFLATNVLGSTTGVINDPCLLQVTGWWGSTVRAGTFDEQNGMFWQWDGQQLAIGRRASTFQLAGTISVTPDSNLVAGSNTRFTSQLIAGDRIVIRGMTHIVTQITNDTTLSITPDYRGSVAASGIKPVRTIDRLVTQNQWNMDRCDGSNGIYNSSGFKIDINKMQMIGLQWTWYGAGFIDWMIRGPEGKFITVHRLRGNNLNTEAFMRSGNQPVRYEVVNESSRSYLTADPGPSGVTLALADVSMFPTPSASFPGYVWIDGEIVSYTGRTTGTVSQLPNGQLITAGTLTGCTRAATLSQFVAGSTRSFTGGSAASHAINTGVILIGQTATPSISHWGSAFITDGGFDNDRGYIFNYQATNISISTRKTTAFAIRLAPSVSNAIVGDLGVRELINRAQLLLQTIEITAGGTSNTNSALVIEGILNPSNYPTNVSNITWNSLNSTALQTGQPSFSQIASGTSVTFANNATNTPTILTGIASGTSLLSVSSISGLLVNDDFYVPSFPTAALGASKIAAVATNTASFSTSVATGGSPSTATASISGTVLTVTTGPTNAGFVVGSVLSGSGITGAPYIVAIISGSSTTANSTFQISSSQVVAPTTITSNTYTLTAGAPSGGSIQLGMVLTGGGVTANTYIIAQTSGAGGGAGTYLLNQTYSGTPTGGSINAVTLSAPVQVAVPASTALQFSRYTYAVPGETVFSFISSPANKDSLDLTPFKELTNTPLGGRGTFPNGPDVLFINVYLTQGAPVLANLVLRWGEAQA